jgi:hypothetical protein
MSQTWNNGAVTFTGLKFNAAGTSDANSASGSLLMDLQVGSVSKFSVNKIGSVSSVQLTATNAVDCNIGIRMFGINGGQLTLGGAASGGIYFTPTTNQGSTPDTILTRRGTANIRLGAADVGATTATVTITIAAPGVVTWTGHTLSTGTPVVFTTTGALPTGITSGTTYYAVIVTDSTFQIASSVANAIAATPTVITTSGTQSGTHTGTRYNITQRLSMQSVTGVTDRLGADLFIQGSQGTGTGAGGSIIFQVAAAGSSGSAQNALATALTIAGTRDATFANNVIVGNDLTATGNVAVAAGSLFRFTSRGSMWATADGVFQFSNNLATDFGRINFGGSTSSFPALKRSSTTLQARLADDSAFASVQGKITTETAYTAGAIVATGYLTLYDSTGSAYRVPCVV